MFFAGDRVLQYLHQFPNLQREEIVKKVIEEFNVDKTTVNNYYTKYKKMINNDVISIAKQFPNTEDNRRFLSYISYDNDAKKPLIFIIYMSDAQKLRLKNAEHWYIDCTFKITPNNFKQTLIIMSRDFNTNIAAPNCFVLMNSQLQSQYTQIFQKIREKVFEGVKENKIKLKSLSSDFETQLMNSITIVFPNERLVGCLFHFKNALYRNFQMIGFTKRENAKITVVLLKLISTLCWEDQLDLEIAYAFIKNKIIMFFDSEVINQFLAYFEKNWLPRMEEGTLNYVSINQQYRSNSILENYNKRIKSKCSKKNPSFSEFQNILIQEEKYFLDKIIEYQTKGEERSRVNNQSKLYIPNKGYYEDLYKQIEYSIKEEEIDELLTSVNNARKRNDKSISLDKLTKVNYTNKQYEENSFKWIKWNNYSCRYDAFFSLFCLVILNRCKEVETYTSSGINSVGNNIIYGQLVETAKSFRTLNFKELEEYWKFRNLNNLELKSDFHTYGEITNLFKVFTNFEKYNIKYNEVSKCNLCNCERITSHEQFFWSITQEDKNLNLNWFSQRDIPFRCPNKVCNKSENVTGNTNIENILWPEHLFFLIMSKIDQLGISEVIKTHDGIVYYIQGSLNGKSGHFTSLVQNPIYYSMENKFQKLNGLYFHDGRKNSGNLIKLDSAKTTEKYMNEHDATIIYYSTKK